MLQPVRLSVKGNQAVGPKAYIFVQSKLQRDDLVPLVYNNAKSRADAAVQFFRDVLKFKPENIFVCEDYTKAQVLEVFKQILEEAKAFNIDEKWGYRDVNAIYINWIGFCLNPDTHDFMGENDSPITYVNGSAGKSGAMSGISSGGKSFTRKSLERKSSVKSVK